MTRAFVTGATGFVGRRLCHALEQQGVLVHRFLRADGNIIDARCLRDAMQKAEPDWVFHLAAEILHGDDPDLLATLFETNVRGTVNVIESARAVKPRALVAIGSFEEYGENPVPYREDMPPRPRTAYGTTKALASLLVAGESAILMSSVVLRFPVVYGPGQSAGSFVGDACNAIRDGKRFAMTPGEQTRDFLYVDDAVLALITAAEQIDSCRGEILNACTGVELSLREAVRMIGSAAGRPDFADIGAYAYRSKEQMHYVGDGTKIALRIGWKAQTSFAEGVRKTLELGRL